MFRKLSVLLAGAVAFTSLWLGTMPVAASGNPAFVQYAGTESVVASIGVLSTFAANTTAGNTLIANIRTRHASVVQPVTDVYLCTGTNCATQTHFSHDTVASKQSGLASSEFWYLENAPAGGKVVKAFIADAGAMAMTVMEVSNVTTLLIWGTKSGSTSNPTVTSNSAIQSNNSIVVADIGWNGASTINGQDTSYTVLLTQTGLPAAQRTNEQMAYKILLPLPLNATESYSAILTPGIAWIALIRSHY